MWYLARAPIAVAAQPKLARRLARAIRALCLPSAKCVVVDLDNTLWGGALGDDGPEGIQLGGGYPGSVFKDVQHLLKQMHRRGFLLAIASKNEETLVRKVLDLHPEMVLRPGDFAAFFANWDPKPTNLRRIAKTLNIGLDALVFVDDNPVERAQVRAELPMVHVVDLPFEPLGYLAALREVAFLDRPRLVAEDRIRAAMYAGEVSRHEVQRTKRSTEEYLHDLHMVATVGECDAMTIERVHQLIQKTNQFNLTTRRHRRAEISRLAGQGDAAVCWLRLRDRFGDLGLICVGILRQIDGLVWEIDTFLMSCRAMGRQVEDAFLIYLLEVAAARGARRVQGIYEPTEKNPFVATFYPRRGFSLSGQFGKKTVYELKVDLGRSTWPSHIDRVDYKSVA